MSQNSSRRICPRMFSLQRRDIFEHDLVEIRRWLHVQVENDVAVWKVLKDLEDGPPFLCPKCGRTYTHKCNLTRHLRLECGVGPRFQCAWCKKRFKHRHHLRDHQRIHLYANCTFKPRN
ncbi:uncharacterized protein LOC143149409 [Ptiloglossa arizonensis]|uniref:uncharacterized protein LOC143149409 n=1 Tax=Ptiloglossa arizonensis TaxID=3350558 RepID=UPI003FA030F0